MPPLPKQIMPVTRTSAQARTSYDRLSHYYDWISGSNERKFMQIGLDMLAIQPNERVLEIGFGTGHGMVVLARQVQPDGYAFGLDLSTGMAEVTLVRLKRAGMGRNTSLVCGDALRLPFPSAVLDAILMSFTLELFDTPEIPLVLAECRRALRCSGRLVVVALSKPPVPRRSVAVYEWFHRRFPQVIDCRPIPLQDFLLDAGFELIQVNQPVMLGLLPLEIVLCR